LISLIHSSHGLHDSVHLYQPRASFQRLEIPGTPYNRQIYRYATTTHDGEAHSSVTYTRKNVRSVTKLYQSREIAKGKVKTNATYTSTGAPLLRCAITQCAATLESNNHFRIAHARKST